MVIILLLGALGASPRRDRFAGSLLISDGCLPSKGNRQRLLQLSSRHSTRTRQDIHAGASDRGTELAVTPSLQAPRPRRQLQRLSSINDHLA
ncbi:hypothetical protein E3C22_15140 [Jiella endophytica]|uniref:Uncharacterized protein n=1 Tax=Jiella endophytica TaxID=2558362 RepID=A0A4Y8RGU5_9HYPH|nr:hypothetical protein [Jiella endophytica]TFF21983.1 hypothetical protein E3C22_15140 [Jiella endophytica]